MHLAINAFFWDRPDTGSGQYVRQLAAHLPVLDGDLRVTLVGPRTPSSSDHPLPPSCTWHHVPSRSGHAGKLIFEQFGFPRACQEVAADIALVPYWGSPMRSPVPVVLTIHDLIPLLLREYRGGPLARLYTGLVAASARSARRVITDSHASKADILAHLGISNERVQVIPLAAGEQFQPGQPDPDVLTKYQLPDQYILYLGSFDLRKNVEALLSAYRYVGPAIGDDFPLVLAGRLVRSRSPRFPDLKTIIHTLGIGDYVHITGYVEEADKPSVYQSAAALVQLSHYEGFGLTPLEAMSCGTPVIVSDRSSLPEVVEAAGFTVDPADVEGIAGAIIACAVQSDLRADLRRRGLAQAAHFSWGQTAEETLKVLRLALS